MADLIVCLSFQGLLMCWLRFLLPSCLHTAYTILYTLYTPYTYHIHTPRTLYTHPTLTLHTLYSHVCTLYTHPTLILYTLCTHPAHSLHTPYTDTLHTPCTYVHTLHTACICLPALHIPCARPASVCLPLKQIHTLHTACTSCRCMQPYS